MTRARTRPDDDSAARHKPGLEDYLRTIGLDVVYEWAQGDRLGYQDDQGRAVEVLDLVGGFGVSLLGHCHKEIASAATMFLESGTANHVQGSIRTGANRLADALSHRAGGDHCVIFANSGTEAIEAALKHAALANGGKRFVAVEGGFHGKTWGALRVTSNPDFRVPFGMKDSLTIRVKADDTDQLRRVMTETDNLAGFLFEPIQGEAGVRPLSKEFIQVAADLCAQRGIPLLADECQTGLGRSGSFLASEFLGVSPDYIILSKALGGGLAKISAVLIKRSQYCRAFDFLHTSTFADDEFSCAIALRVLELLDDAAISRCRSQGEFLLRELQGLQYRYPSVIAEVRGRGLMIGVELRRPAKDAGFMLRHLSERRLLGPFVASYLLHAHQVRVATTLSDSSTLRIQPSLLINRSELRLLVEAMESVCRRLVHHDLVGLTRFLTKKPSSTSRVPLLPSSQTPVYQFGAPGAAAHAAFRPDIKKPPTRVAWIFHLIDSSDLVYLDDGLQTLTDAEKSGFCDRWSALAEPVVMDPIEIQSSTSGVVSLHPILLPVTSQWMLKNARGKQANAAALVQRGVDAAAAIGCSIVSLGQFTSIVTRRGESLQPRGLQITAGGSYTAALVGQAIGAELNRKSRDPSQMVLGIVGATGDIAATCASMLGPGFKRSVLVGSGRVGSVDRLRKLACDVPRASIATDMRAIDGADVVVCATNSITSSIGPEILHPDAIVCDASVPAALNPSIFTALPSVTVCPGAIAELPNRERFQIPGFPLPPGFTYGCMAEGLLLGLDGSQPHASSGRSTVDRAWVMSRMAAKHGFQVAKSSAVACSSGFRP